MEQEIKQVKTLIATGGLVALAYTIGFFLSFVMSPEDEVKRNIIIASCVLFGAFIAISLTVKRIWKELE